MSVHLFAWRTTTTARLTDDAEAMGNDLDPVLCTGGPATAHRRPHAIQLLGRLFPTDLPSPAGPTFRLSATELLPFRERVQDGIGMPGAMAAVARPGRLARVGHHRGPHRVGLDVPQNDEQVVAVLDDRRSEAALPDVAAGSLSPVVPPGVSDGQGLEDAAERLPGGRLEKQMKMVGHQAVAEERERNISRSLSGLRTSARLFPRLIAWSIRSSPVGLGSLPMNPTYRLDAREAIMTNYSENSHDMHACLGNGRGYFHPLGCRAAALRLTPDTELSSFLEGICMQRRAHRLVMAGAALALAAVVIAGAVYSPRSCAETPEASMPTVAGMGKDKPTVAYWHVWTDEKGVSHQDRCEMSAFKLQSISEGAAPSWIDKQSTPGATVLVVVQPVGWVGEWHENPKPQWIIPLSGRWSVETMDGKRVEMGPGEVSFGGDQNTKPDAKVRKGHRSGTVGDQPAVTMLVQLEEDPFVRGQDSAPSTTKTQLGPVDTYFITQTSLGTPFQTDSGRIAKKKG